MTYGISPTSAIIEAIEAQVLVVEQPEDAQVLVTEQPVQTIVLTGIGVPGPTGPEGPAGAAETPESILAKIITVDGAGSLLDADTLDGQHGVWYQDIENHTGIISDTQHGIRAGGNLHAQATTSVAGFMAAGDKAKLDTIQSGATDDMTPAELLTAIKTVDGAGSGLDADTLDGQNGTWYLDRVNHTGTQGISTVSGLQTALDLKAPLASPGFTGNPTAPTPGAGDSDTSIATTAFVTTAIGSAVGGASIDWSQIVNEPATFPPTVPIPWTDVSGKPATFPPTVPIAWTNISGTPATYPPTLPIAQTDVTNLVSDLALKAPLASPTFTGDPKAPTPATADNDTSVATTAFVKAQGYGAAVPPATVLPLVNGTAAVGTVAKYAKEDHIHPIDTSRAPLASPTFTGDPKAPTPTAGDNDTSLATTAFVTTAVAAVPTVPPATVTPLMDGTAAVGTVAKYAKEDHRHPTDTSREATIAAGTTAQYWRGDKSWQTLPPPGISDAPSDSKTYGRKNAAWAEVVAGGGGASVTISDTPPGSPTVGSLWYESDSGNTYIWYTDADSSQWVQQNIQPGTISGMEPEFIKSVSVDASWRFRPAGTPANYKNRLALNDKADGSGKDVFFITDIGEATSNGAYAGNGFHDGTSWRVVSAGWMGLLNIDPGSGSFSYYTHTATAATGAAVSVTPVLTVTNGGALYAPVVTATQNFQTITVNAILSPDSDGTIYLRPGGPNAIPGQLTLNGTELTVNSTSQLVGNCRCHTGYTCKAGSGGGFYGNLFNIGWTGSAQLYIDTTNVGTISLTSDYRIKKDVADLASTWDQVKAIRPIKYTNADFQPPMSDETKAAMLQKAIQKYANENSIEVEEVDPKDVPEPKPADEPLFRADDIERWGFIAHEVQETLTHSAAEGEKDMEDGVQSLNLAAILAATVKALQEAMARIEVLEAAS